MSLKIKELWKFNYTSSILKIEIVDINGNGQFEIIAITKSGVLLILSSNGKLLKKQIISKEKPLWHLKICDIDNDGRFEILLGGFDGVLRIFKCNSEYNLELFWSHKFLSSISGILIDDINNDNEDEVIAFSLDKTLRVLKSNSGDLIWGQIFEDGIGDAIIIKNEHNSHKIELIACGNDGTVRCFDGFNGKLLWFKKHVDKIRSIAYMNKNKQELVLYGGDDKKLYIINKKSQKEIKIIEFNDYVWKCLSYPYPVSNKALVSSYSFSYFNKSGPIDNFEFTSQLICLDQSLNINWELIGYNIEFLNVLNEFDQLLVFATTTKGELLIIEERTGNILYHNLHKSCANMIQILSKKRLLLECFDNGMIITYKLDKS